MSLPATRDKCTEQQPSGATRQDEKGRENFAVDADMTMSQSVTYVTPPPNAGPLTAATMGLPKPTNELNSSASPIEIYDASSEGCTGLTISSNLAPAQKYEPRPVTTRDDVALSPSKVPSMQIRPRLTAASNELLFLDRL